MLSMHKFYWEALNMKKWSSPEEDFRCLFLEGFIRPKRSIQSFIEGSANTNKA